MNQPFYYGCGGGCKNCPRRRECAMAGSAAAVPVLAEQPLTPMAGSGAAAPMPAIPKDNPPAAAPTEIPWEPVPANLPVVRLPAVLTSDTMDAYPELTAFLQENHQRGVLRIQAFRGQQSIPMEGVRVSVSRPMDERLFLFFEDRTDASGIIDSIVLPACRRLMVSMIFAPIGLISRCIRKMCIRDRWVTVSGDRCSASLQTT